MIELPLTHQLRAKALSEQPDKILNCNRNTITSTRRVIVVE